VLNPEPVEGYSKPVSPGELPDPGNGTGVLTLNLANGADDKYRTAENREDQAALIRDTGATIVGLQEVDVGLGRSGNVNTALDIARQLNPSFNAFTNGTSVPTVPIGEEAPATAIRKGGDGTTLYQTPEGTLVTGESFSGDDRGGLGTRDASATYGNAVYVAAPEKVVDAYTVTLPTSTSGDGRPVSSTEDLAALGDGKVSDTERTALAQRNDALRKDNPVEPRSALVTRVVGPDGREKSIINVHLTAGGDQSGLRAKQLALVADLARAEGNGPPQREVVVMGDFNDSTKNVGAALEGAGLHRVVGGKKEGINNYDQIWTSGGLDTDTSAQVETGGNVLGHIHDSQKGVSDHPYAGYTVIR
jgi:endonuclease/exonuclease/phosphatase family metal-dependent hydrolase